MTYRVYRRACPLGHTSWNSKNHIVFAQKNRRKKFYGKKDERQEKVCKHCEIGDKKRRSKGMSRPVHLLVEIPEKVDMSSFMC